MKTDLNYLLKATKTHIKKYGYKTLTNYDLVGLIERAKILKGGAIQKEAKKT